MTIRAWGDATPEYWIDGRQHRPLRRRHSGKGVPFPCAVLDPNRSFVELRVREPQQGLVAFRHLQNSLKRSGASSMYLTVC
jgi:hypothetical protein